MPMVSRFHARAVAVLVAAALAAPASLAAHPGHGEGDHGWLAGAIQPFLAPDHLLAGVFVLGVGALGMVVVGRHRAGKDARERR